MELTNNSKFAGKIAANKMPLSSLKAGLFVFFIFALGSDFSWGSSRPSKAKLGRKASKRQPAEFLTPQEAAPILRKIPQGQLLPSAVTFLQIADTPCSASRISDQGHLLLASHCIDTCLDQLAREQKLPQRAVVARYAQFEINGAARLSKLRELKDLEKKIKAGGQSQKIAEWTVDRDLIRRSLDEKYNVDLNFRIFEPDPKRPVICPVALASRPQQIYSAKVLVANPCHRGVFESETGLKEIPKEIFPASCKEGGDIAILELPTEALKHLTCLSLGSPPRIGDQVLGIGYPEKSYRKSQFNSNGVHVFITHGVVLNTESCTKANGQIFSAPRLFGYQRYPLQVSNDALVGSSGGPLVNFEGRIVGVASNVVRHQSSMEECRGATRYESVDALEAAQKFWPGTPDRQAFRCQEHAVVRSSNP